MASKKEAPKKVVSAAKAAKPASKTPAKKAAPTKNVQTASKKSSVQPPHKAPPKKALPAPAKATKAHPAATKSAPVAAKKMAAPPAKKEPPVKAETAPKKGAPVKNVSPAKNVAPVKGSVPAKSAAPVKSAPAKEIHPPVKKSSVAAPTQQEVKPAIKPLEKITPKKEANKPVVVPKTTTTKKVKYEPEFMKSVLDAAVPNQNSGPTQRYSDSELKEFKDLINKKLDTAKKELAYLQGLITRKDESGDIEDGRYMTMEDGSMSMEREQLSQMASRQITFIDHLEKAIMRIENKTYGICRVTGKLIDKARLRAVPHATLSIEAKQMMNK